MTSPTAPRLYPAQGRQLTVKINQGGQSAAIVLGFRGAGAWSGAGVAEAVLGAAWGAFRPLMPTSVQCLGATWRDVSVPEGPSFDAPAPAGVQGTSSLGGGVAAACTLLRWTTGTGGRSGRGRTYIPSVPFAALNSDGRTLTSGQITAAQTAITAYLGSGVWADQGLQPAVLSFTKGLASPITGGTPVTVAGIQRRRMRD